MQRRGGWVVAATLCEQVLANILATIPRFLTSPVPAAGHPGSKFTQLTADGLLLDEDDRPLDKNEKGVKSKQHRIDGKRSRCVRIKIGEICEARVLMVPRED